MIKWVLFLFALPLLIYGCATTQGELQPEKTQLQIREFQTRVFDISDVKLVMKALINVLQDDGFIVKNAVPDLGLISAEKAVDIENKTESAWLSFWLGYNAEWKKASVIECTANVNEYGKQVKVRVSFLAKILTNKGGIKEIKQIDDEKYYQDFFSKIDKGIFIQKEKI